MFNLGSYTASADFGVYDRLLDVIFINVYFVK